MIISRVSLDTSRLLYVIRMYVSVCTCLYVRVRKNLAVDTHGSQSREKFNYVAFDEK